jgi:5-formyltetrahydrofolate cyclo-ligase
VTDGPALQADKAALRRGLRARRREAAAGCPDAALRLMDHFPMPLAKLSPIGGYWPVGSEIDPRVLMAALARGGAQVALPRVVAKTGPTRFMLWQSGVALQADAFGVPSPPPDAPEVTPKLLLVPLLGFDRRGGRLGQGGGHYDRVLAALRPGGLVAVGLAFGAQEVPAVPLGAHDQALDWIVTPEGAVRCA